MKSLLIPITAIALATAACTEEQEVETYNQKTQAISIDSKLEDRITNLYGSDASKYALQIIDNGRRIRDSPGKQENLYDIIEKNLKRKFPLISPLRLFGFIDEPREAENVAMLYKARQKVLSRAAKHGINLPMSFIIAALSNEGFSLDLDNVHSHNNSGFMSYGLDNFGTEFKRISQLGYLPASFRDHFTISEHVNETGHLVKSADFKNREDAYEAFIATLAHRQYLLFEDLSRNRIKRNKIPREQVLFFTYKYYNGGPNSAEKLLKKRSAKEIDRFFKRVITYGSTGNAYVVLAGSQWLELSGALDLNPNGKYWWSR